MSASLATEVEDGLAGEVTLGLDNVVNLRATITVEYTGKRGEYLYATKQLGEMGFVPSDEEMASIDVGALSPSDFLELGEVIAVKVEAV